MPAVELRVRRPKDKPKPAGRAEVTAAVRRVAMAEGRIATQQALLALAEAANEWAEQLSVPERVYNQKYGGQGGGG